jgi:hypothetical protein
MSFYCSMLFDDCLVDEAILSLDEELMYEVHLVGNVGGDSYAHVCHCLAVAAMLGAKSLPGCNTVMCAQETAFVPTVDLCHRGCRQTLFDAKEHSVHCGAQGLDGLLDSLHFSQDLIELLFSHVFEFF